MPTDESYVPGFTTQTLSFADPDSRTLGVTWRTTIPSPSPAVELSVEGDSEEDRRIIPAFSSEESPVGGFVHKAIIDGLDPASEYSYRVGDSEKEKWWKFAHITTREDSPDDFDFLFFCDSQTSAAKGWEPLHKTIRSALRTTPDARFALHGGDFVQYGSVEPHWRDMIDENADFFRETPVMAASGNHEIVNGGRPFCAREHFVYPIPGEQTDPRGDYYSFDYGILHVVILNTNGVIWETQEMEREQIKWLEDDLRNSTARWKIVVMHFETYSSGAYGYLGNDGRRSHGFRRDLAPLFCKYGVDLVLQGHDHVFVRTHHIDADGKVVECPIETRDFRGCPTEYHISPGAPIYYNSGAAGGNRGRLSDAVDDPYLYVRSETDVNCSYGTIHLTSGELTLRTFVADGYKKDILFDSFGIVK